VYGVGGEKMDKRLGALLCYVVTSLILIGIFAGLIFRATSVKNPLAFAMFFIVTIMVLLIFLANIEIVCDVIELLLDKG
jgi:CBS domain containing-hemolysin-like protein